LEHALTLADYDTKRAAHARFNISGTATRRGIGVATFHHGAGFTGSGEVMLASRLDVAGLADGSIEIRSANIEMGQGTLTVFTALAAQRLGLDPAYVRIAEVDTARVPNSGPTVASRTAMVVGRLVERACDDLRRRLDVAGATGDALRQALRSWHEGHLGAELVGQAKYEPPPGVVWDDVHYRGDAYGTFGWGAYVAEVEVDLRTYETRVIDFVAVQDVGKVLHEVLARGQVQGGVAQAIGWALLEDCRWKDGAMVNAQLTNYLIPTSDDLPHIRVAFLETPYSYGAQGAKGLGELPMDGPAPAIVNAVAAATGADPCVIPLTPERLMGMIEGRMQNAELGARDS
jgi:CO/xanthine dehydrogenase Mo-binding subunit